MSTTAAAIASQRFHFGLTVTNLDHSVEFYRMLLGADPVKYLPEYAKFDVADPPVVLALHPGQFATSGALNHVGFRLPTSAALVAVQARLERQGIRTQREEGVECCYALQTKFWVPDPDGNLWEVYTLEQDLDHSGFGGEGEGMPPRPVVPAVSVSWDHQLTQPLPERIPHADDSVDVVRLEGTFNMELPDGRRQSFLAEVFRVLRPGGRVWIHGLVSDRPFPGRPQLPGPAALVQFIPQETQPAEELLAMGFVGLHFDKFGDIHCFRVNGVELRQLQLEAQKPLTPTKTEEHYVLYRGPADRVTDDQGRTFIRGVRQKVDASIWNQLRSSPFDEHFTCFACHAAEA